MTKQKKAAEREEQGGQITSGNVHVADCTSAQRPSTQPIAVTARPTKPSSRPTKTAVILKHLTLTGSLNRFEAQHLGDSALNSTISTLANTHGIIFDRQQEKVPNRFGSKSWVTRYKVSNCSEDKAIALLKFWRVPHD